MYSQKFFFLILFINSHEDVYLDNFIRIYFVVVIDDDAIHFLRYVFFFLLFFFFFFLLLVMKIITIPTWTCLLWYIISLIPGIWNPTEIFLFVINKSVCVCVSINYLYSFCMFVSSIFKINTLLCLLKRYY